MNLYIGNLDYNTTEEELRQIFAEHGQISSVKIIKDRDTFRSKGFGFVEIPNSEEAKRAIELLNGKEVGNQIIIVNEAKPKDNHSRGSKFGNRRSR